MTEIEAVSILNEAECWKALHSNAFGRLGLSVSNQPEIFPINYAVQSGTLVFRTAQGTKLAALTINGAVVLEIDGYDDHSGWSVVVKGRAHAAEWGDDFDEAQLAGLRPWVATQKPVFVRVEPEHVSGRRFLFGPEPDNILGSVG
jgi:nitroimidazol reductase NimA-like FMN-containing flavoprotein (pyridoxamine 5'-phosphate oxidase superfamily)